MQTNDPIESRREAAKIPTMREVFRYGASRADASLELATRRYEVLLDQRDRHADRMRFGALSINAASLFALGAMIGDKQKLGQLGLDQKVIIYAAVAFVLGSLLSALGIYYSSLHMISRTPEAYRRVMDREHEKGLMDSPCSESIEAQYQDALDRHKSGHVDPDYSWSPVADRLTSFSGSLWFVGVVIILGTMISALW